MDGSVMCHLELAADLARDWRRGWWSGSRAKFRKPLRRFDHGPGNGLVMERADFVDMGREHDPQRALASALGRG